MKEMKIEIEFVTRCLALSPNRREGDTDWFRKDSEGNLIWNQAWWYSAITNTAKMYEIRSVKPSMFNFCPVVAVVTTEVYKRKYGSNSYRSHECIPTGTRAVFTAVVADQITESVLYNLLEKMGMYVGLSPYGHRLGYGKFTVKSVDLVDCNGLLETK
jgi:hypothetical protein